MFAVWAGKPLSRSLEFWGCWQKKASPFVPYLGFLPAGPALYLPDKQNLRAAKRDELWSKSILDEMVPIPAILQGRRIAVRRLRPAQGPTRGQTSDGVGGSRSLKQPLLMSLPPRPPRACR